ncbi:MAG: signal peptidase I [Actinobacteria bacterium]|nr:signal peptidase I [Actinomycetota bacterium]
MSGDPGSDEPGGGTAGAGDGPGRDSQHSAARSFARGLPFLILVALVFALLIKTFLVQAFSIPSPSMVPTLEPGDRILVDRLAYRFGDIHRGDVVVFSDPSATHHRSAPVAFFRWLVEGTGIAGPEDEDFVKRVIGLPGDTVEIAQGQVFVNGRKLDEPYLNRDPDTRSFGPVAVPPGQLFVLGDNRLRSGDSRFPPPEGLGFVPIDHVVGRAFLIVWPPDRVGGIA